MSRNYSDWRPDAEDRKQIETATRVIAQAIHSLPEGCVPCHIASALRAAADKRHDLKAARYEAMLEIAHKMLPS